jgi:putative ABC transport system substrate-binding protein
MALLAGAAATRPSGAGAQTRLPRIGILLHAGPDLMGPLPEALRELGYIDGANIRIEIRSAGGQAGRLPELAAELVRLDVDVIVASQAPAIAAARNAAGGIPIVMAPGGEPVALGFIASLARPGGTITGVTSPSAELSAKILEMIPDFLPGARRVGVLGNATDPFVKPLVEAIEKGALTVGLEVRPVLARGNGELETAFAALARERVEAVVVQPSLSVKLTADLALTHRLPSLSTAAGGAHDGHLASYSASLAERARQIAAYADAILKGTRPSDLPVRQPTVFETRVNLKTAKALGLAIPAVVLARADEVIE